MSEQSCSIHGLSAEACNCSADEVSFAPTAENPATNVQDAIENATQGDVDSFNGRTGVVVPLAADYEGFFFGSALTQGSVLFADAAGKIEDDNANLFYDDTNNRLHVGDRSGGAATGAFNAYGTVFLTPTGLIGDGVIIGSNAALDAGVALQVVGRASEKTAIFRANATTPGNVLEVQDSAGALKFGADGLGRAAIGTAVNAAHLLLVSGTHPGTGAIITGVTSSGTAPATATTSVSGVRTGVTTAAAAFTTANGYALEVVAPSVGAGSAVTTQSGVRIFGQGAAGITNAYGMLLSGVTGAATLNVGARIDSSSTCALWIDGGANGTAANDGIMFGSSRDTVLYRQAANRLGTGAGDQFAAGSKIYPGTDAGALQTASGLFAGTGAPNNANGADGDIYFRSDGGALTTIYQRRAGTWVGVA